LQAIPGFQFLLCSSEAAASIACGSRALVKNNYKICQNWAFVILNQVKDLNLVGRPLPAVNPGSGKSSMA
jgi:hypothetical protein